MQVVSFLSRHWIVLGMVMLGVGIVFFTVPRLLADRAASVATIATNQASYENGEKPALLNAPSEVQDCVKAQIGDEAFQAIAVKVRSMESAEAEIMNGCFRDVLSPDVDRSESKATETSAKSATPKSTSSSATPSTESQVSAPQTSNTPDPGQPSSTPESSSPPPPKEKSPTDDLHAEVWSKNGYGGASYEYKVNCGSNYTKLEECFLWDLTRVAVSGPDGRHYALNKDFNVNGYSGEITRRWVLYGPAEGGLPVAGEYTFTYYKGDNVAHIQTVDYTPSVVAAPSGIVWERRGDDLYIAWQAPSGINSTMWYKPSIDPPGNDRQIISKTIAWDQTSAILESPPVNAGEEIEINVAVFFPGGYAYPQPIKVTW